MIELSENKYRVSKNDHFPPPEQQKPLEKFRVYF